MGLAATLLTVVFQFLLSNTRFTLHVEEAQQALREQQRLRERIDSLFSSLYPTLSAPGFYTATVEREKGMSLLAQFDAGIDPDPAFSGVNRGRLFVDEKKQLCFTQQPLVEERSRTEVLLTDVRDVEWEFLGPYLKKEGGVKLVGKDWAWFKAWPKKTGGVPSIVRLSLWRGIDKKKQREPNLRIAFILPFQEPIRIVKDS